jgi:hypothetical protein
MGRGEMTERERLVGIIRKAEVDCANTIQCEACEHCGKGEQCQEELIADYLLANGVIVPPCKVGDTVWCIHNYTKPKKFQISILTMSENHYSFVIETKDGVYKHYCDKDSVGKWVFFTREEAEKALAERSRG